MPDCVTSEDRLARFREWALAKNTLCASSKLKPGSNILLGAGMHASHGSP